MALSPELVDLQVSHLMGLAKEHAVKTPALARYYLETLQRLVHKKQVKLNPAIQEQACPYCSSLLVFSFLLSCWEGTNLVNRKRKLTRVAVQNEGEIF